MALRRIKSSFIRENSVEVGGVASLKQLFQETEHFYRRPEKMDQYH